MELAIDTSTDSCSIGLSKQGETIAELTWHSGQSHTVELVPNVVSLLNQNKTSPQSLTAVFVAKGPGSFNGLRVGMSTAKGLAFSREIPLVGVGTLEVEAFPYALTGRPIHPVLDAARGEIASASYRYQQGEWHQLVAEHIATVDELCRDVAPGAIICGRLPPRLAQEVERQLGGQAIIVKATLRRAGYLAELGWRRLQKGDTDNLATLQPLYLRRPSVTLKTQERKEDNLEKTT